MRWTIAVASWGRAGNVTSDGVFPEAVIVVPESQADAYRAAKPTPDLGGSYLEIPDSQDGNLCRKRNAIMDRFLGKRNLGNLLIVDDDYLSVDMIEGGREVPLGPEDIERVLFRGFTMVRDAGTVLWGINVQADPKFYREYTPVTFLSPVLGPWQAFADCPLRYDEDLWLKEDYDMSLRVLHRYHRILRFGKYHYRVDHFDRPGGQVAKRSWDEEVRQLQALQRRWGPEVVRFDLTKSVNPVLKVPLKGV